ncbi:M23 family metallopeptidase [Streptomyces sp. NPDC050560]|uniref:M23 family metallopeptidase n=1 Tax=Streptomyces sp. NPDC050560 TaxID=3365630 RepID=UPI0037992309
MALLLLNAALILAALALAHWYLLRRLVKDVSRERGGWRRVGTGVIALLAATTVAVLTVGPAEAPFEVTRVTDLTAAVWLPVLLYLTLALLVGEPLRPLLRRLLARRAARRAGGPGDTGAVATAGDAAAADASRRLVVARAVAIGATTLAMAGTAAGRSGGGSPAQRPEQRGLEVAWPFSGRWRVQNSPARRVPSHGTRLMGSSYAIDFIAVDEQHRTAGSRSWRTFLASEPPELFYAFGKPVHSPVDGTVVAAHDAEEDHEARRSQLALIPYTLGQGARLREGVHAIAGNHVIIKLPGSGHCVALAHFKSGSVRVSPGDKVVTGQHIADCGNSGNSTQPHVHIQAMDSSDISHARGLPMLFRPFREWASGPRGRSRVRERTVPGEEVVVRPLSDERA